MGWATLFLLALAAPSAVLGQSCSSNDDCSDGNVCGYSQVDGTADRVCCPESVRQFVGRNEYGFTSSGTRRYFCTGRSDGTKCGTFDDVCSSGACVLETCQAQKLDANEVCKISNDCESSACVYGSVDGATDPVCCESGSTSRHFVGRNQYGFTSYGTGRYFCTDQPDGNKCGAFDDVCSSGACVLETCQAQKLDANEVCKISNDCESLACAYGSVDGATDPVCCESGSTSRHFVGRNQYGFTSSGTGRYFCTDQPDRIKCGAFDDVCSSGACVLETCQAQKLDANEVCKISNDCESPACAYGSVDGTTDPVCCGSGSIFRQYIGRNQYGFTSSGTGRYFCTDQPDKTKCGAFDDVCASGHCVCGACEEEGFICETDICGPDGCLSELLQPGAECIADNNCILGECGDDGTCAYLEDSASCTEGLDSQCGSQACAREKVAQDSEYVCCSSGAKLVEEDSSLPVCTLGGVLGDSCFSDIICKSSICTEGTCKGGLQKEGESCEKDGHCHSGTCSGSKCAPFPTLEERNSYCNDRAVCPFATLDNSNARGFVTLQVFGDSTSRSWSSQLFNEVRDEKRDRTGTDNMLEGHKVLDALDGCADGSAIIAQRQGDSVCFSYQFQDVGDDGADSSCKSTCIRFGGSRSLETYDKLTTNVVGGLFGVPVTAYYFGENRKCRIEVSMEQSAPTATVPRTMPLAAEAQTRRKAAVQPREENPTKMITKCTVVETALPTKSPIDSSTASLPTRSPLIAPSPASVTEIVVDGEGVDSDEGAGPLIDDNFANDTNVGDPGAGEGEESIGPTITGGQQLPDRDENKGLSAALGTIALLIAPSPANVTEIVADGEGDDSDEGAGPLLGDDFGNDTNVGGSDAGEGEENIRTTITGEQQHTDRDGSEGLSAASQASRGAARKGGLSHWMYAIALTGFTWMFA